MVNTVISVYLICHISLPALCEESLETIFWFIFSFTYAEAINTISTPNFWWVCFCTFIIVLFNRLFFVLFLRDRIITGFHVADLLCFSAELDVLKMIWFTTRAGFLLFVWPLHVVTFRVNSKYFKLLWGVSGDIKQVCLFCTGRPIARIYCMFSLAIAIADILGVVRQVWIPPFISWHDWHGWYIPQWFFVRCSPFLDLFIDFHFLKHISSLLECFHLEVPSL